MLILSELPVAFILAPKKLLGILITLFFVIAGCLLAQKFNLYKKQQQERKYILLAAIIAVFMGIVFTFKWRSSSKVAAIANIIHLSPGTFLIIIAALLSIASVWGIGNLILVMRRIGSRIPDDEPTDLYMIASRCSRYDLHKTKII